MAGQGAYMNRAELMINNQYPLNKQKEIMSKILRFNSEDVERFEKEHPEIIKKKENNHVLPDSEMVNDSIKSAFDRHSPGYRTVVFRGKFFKLTEKQGAILKVLDETPGHELHYKEINDKLPEHLHLASVRPRIDNSFKKMNMETSKMEYVEIWGKIITNGEKAGFFRLNT